MKKITLKIDGMTCAACKNALEKSLRKTDGIDKADVNLILNDATIVYDEANLSIKQIEKVIKKTGYQSLGIAGDEREEEETHSNLIIIGMLSFIIFYLSMAHMVGLPSLDMHRYPIIYSLILWILTTIVFVLGKDLLISGIQKLIHLKPNMDSLVTIGVMSAYLYSIYNTVLIFSGGHDQVMNLYYDSASMVLFFIELGKYFDKTSKKKTKDAISKLFSLAPEKAIVLHDGKEEEISIAEIKVGDLLIARPGDKIAVDGVIQKGMTTIDESSLTGESLPALKKVGDKVISGTLNYDGVITYLATEVQEDTLLQKIIALVIDATNSKAPMAAMADKISGYFVPVIIGLATLSLMIWLLLGYDFSFALNIFVSVLVISCPCALGLATPLSMMIATGLSAERGILIHDSKSLEIVSKAKTIVFDKTGTLTEGKLEVTHIWNHTDLGKDEFMSMVGALEYHVTHPIALSIQEWCQKHGIQLSQEIEIQNIPGYGIQGVYEGKTYLIGNQKYMEKNHVSLDEELSLIKSYQEEGNTILFVSDGTQMIGMIAVKDRVRSESKEVISILQSFGFDVVMLTGDHYQTANYVAKELGITHVVSEVLPQHKQEQIEKLKEQGYVIMVGDGINDAPSLVSADVGIAMGNGTSIALDSADMILMNSQIHKMIDIILLSKKTVRNMKQNLFWAFFYNTIMIPIAMGIFIPFHIMMNPMIAGAAMTLSSVTVVSNALRLKKIKFGGK